jgi:predicted transcriptional regulator
METIKLFDSELKLMEILWEKEPISAREISLIAAQSIGWNKNTTYTILNKLIGKKYIQRSEPNFICTSSIRKEEVQAAETKNLIEKLYEGSKKAFFAAFIKEGSLTDEELDEIKKLIEKR